ncbi:hypothetical protein [Lysobacter enzymogenes]|uniref:DUF1877 family protein n=1 Tax=Lysobacter enzymogenes TaxID=69 RepID=A0A3N2RKH3_LYSEN|nr:hypothetical protein [Lysobacter enzymogenes]ROU07899.1 hypothetical protein D9T17_06770 [Lysobacter enzymogenes]
MAGYLRIHPERRDATGRFEELPETDRLRARNYTRFAFLAGVSNWANIVPISPPRGLPDDASETVRRTFANGLRHATSWLTLDELLNFDYDQPLRFREDVRPEQCTAGTYRELLDDDFLQALRDFRAQGATRLVFWFDY